MHITSLFSVNFKLRSTCDERGSSCKHLVNEVTHSLMQYYEILCDLLVPKACVEDDTQLSLSGFSSACENDRVIDKFVFC